MKKKPRRTIPVKLDLPVSLIERLQFIAEQSFCTPQTVMRVLLTISMMQRRSDFAAAMPPVPPRARRKKARA